MVQRHRRQLPLHPRGPRVGSNRPPTLRGEVQPTVRQPARWQDDQHNPDAGGLPFRWAPPRPMDRGESLASRDGCDIRLVESTPLGTIQACPRAPSGRP